MKKVTIPGIFDLEDDGEGVLRMPFNPIDWGSDEANAIKRECYECGKLFPQGTMKTLGSSAEDPKAIAATVTVMGWDYVIFFCRDCWFKSPISDAGNWYA